MSPRRVRGIKRKLPVRSSNLDGIPHNTFLWMIRLYRESTNIYNDLMSSPNPSVELPELLLKIGIIKRMYKIMEQLLLNPGIGDSCLRRTE